MKVILIIFKFKIPIKSLSQLKKSKHFMNSTDYVQYPILQSIRQKLIK